MRRRRFAPASALLVTALSIGTACAVAAPAQAVPGEQGYVVMIGGGIVPNEDPTDLSGPSEAIMQQIVDLAQQHAGAGNTPRIAVLTTASSVATSEAEATDPEEDNATVNGTIYYKEWFERHGADVYPVPIDVNPGEDYPGDPYSADNANDADVADAVRDSDAVYFGGGDQINYVRALFNCTAPDAAAAAKFAYTECVDTPVMEAIRDVVNSGGVSAGTSAGLTIQQGVDMISGGDPYESWRDGAEPGWYDSDTPESSLLTYVPAGGLGFFTEGLVDSHFARRDRQPRIVRLALHTGHPLSFGVEEKTALVVDRAARTGTVIGELGASLLDTSEATIQNRNATGIRYSYFMTGSTIDFATGEITLASPAHTGAGTEAPPAVDNDVWKTFDSDSCDSDPWIFGNLNLAQAFVKSTAADAYGDTCDSPIEQPRFRTSMFRDAQTTWADDGSFLNLGLSFTERPDFTVAAALIRSAAASDAPNPAAAATAAASDPSLTIGSTANVAVTIANTGNVAIGGFTLTQLVEGGTPTTTQLSDVPALQPGASTTVNVQFPVAAGTKNYLSTVSAITLDGAGAPLQIVLPSAEASVQLTGVKKPDDGGGTDTGGPEKETGGTGKNQTGSLAATGGESPAALGLIGFGALLAAAGVFAAAAARRRLNI